MNAISGSLLRRCSKSSRRAGRTGVEVKTPLPPILFEDEGLIARDIENMVHNAGYEVCGIAGTGKEAVDISRIPLDDAKTFSLLSSGETAGVFQLEGAGMRRQTQ